MKGILIHFDRRNRSRKLEDYPSKKPKYQLLDKIISVVIILTPLSTIPQIYEVWVDKNVEGLSFLTWGLYLFLTFPLLTYAFIHKNKSLITMYSLWLIIHISIFLGIIAYN